MGQYGSLFSSLSVSLSHTTEDLTPFERNKGVYIFITKFHANSFLTVQHSSLQYGYTISTLKVILRNWLRYDSKRGNLHYIYFKFYPPLFCWLILSTFF